MADPMTLVSSYDPHARGASSPQLTMQSVASGPRSIVSPGYQFGRYRVDRTLGSGGMAAVYLCHDPVLGRMVAVKATIGQNGDVNSGLRFLREAEVLARLQHPHVVSVFDVGMQGQTAYIVMEYVEGYDLRTLLELRKRLTVPMVLTLMMPLFSAIGYAHRRNVLHLDLKPSNVLLSTDHLGQPFPKVLDFGVCVLSDVDSELDPTRSEFAGTPAYSAPEAIRRRELTDKTDQFALGVMLFEMLSGVNPFTQCSTLTETLMVMEQRRYPRLSSLTPHLSVEVANVIARALDPNPEARHASVDELARALAAACGKPELALMELPVSR